MSRYRHHVTRGGDITQFRYIVNQQLFPHLSTHSRASVTLRSNAPEKVIHIEQPTRVMNASKAAELDASESSRIISPAYMKHLLNLVYRYIEDLHSAQYHHTQKFMD